MSDFDIIVYDRNGGIVPIPSGAIALPQRWSAKAIGGPHDAEVRIDGPRAALFSLSSWLGYEVRIVNRDGQAVWWGDIEEIELTISGLTLGVSLANFANRIQVRYTAKQAGGQSDSADTAWLQDDASVTQYGTWERRINATGEMKAAEAEAQRYTALQRLATPTKTLRPGAPSGTPYATLRCSGYWQRLKRFYYVQPAGMVEHTEGSTTWPVGLGFTSSTVAFAATPKTINETYGRLKNFGGYDGLQVRVSGATNAGNNGAKTIENADGKDANTYTATTIRFGALDDIGDSANGLAWLEVNDVIQISGSASNNGTDIVKTVSAVGDGVEVSPGYGGAINNESAGASVTIRRGNAVTVTESLVNELVGASVTVTAYGQRIYQAFTLPSNNSWTVDTVELRVARVGTVTDNLRVRLYSDSSGTPGTLLETVDVTGSTIAEDSDWVEVNFSNTTQLNYGTTYGIEVSRTGSNDPDNYYVIDVDTDAGYSGTLRVHDGSTWQTPATDMDLQFRVLGGVDNANQISSIVMATGSGMQGVFIESTANVVGNQYREGDLTGIDEAEDLLERGTSGGFRMLATVTAERWVRIFTEPLESAARFTYDENRELRTLQGSKAIDGLVPAGEWVHVSIGHELPDSWAAMSPIFVERAEYRVDDGLTLEPVGMDAEFEIGSEVG